MIIAFRVKFNQTISAMSNLIVFLIRKWILEERVVSYNAKAIINLGILCFSSDFQRNKIWHDILTLSKRFAVKEMSILVWGRNFNLPAGKTKILRELLKYKVPKGVAIVNWAHKKKNGSILAYVSKVLYVVSIEVRA